MVGHWVAFFQYADYFSGLGRAVGRVCVCVGKNFRTKWPFTTYLAWWLNVLGHIRRSRSWVRVHIATCRWENPQQETFSAMLAR